MLTRTTLSTTLVTLLSSTLCSHLHYGKFTQIENLDLPFDMANAICSYDGTRVWLMNDHHAAIFHQHTDTVSDNQITGNDPNNKLMCYGAQTYTRHNTLDGQYPNRVYTSRGEAIWAKTKTKSFGVYTNALSDTYVGNPGMNAYDGVLLDTFLNGYKPWTGALCLYPIDHTNSVMIHNGGEDYHGKASAVTFMWVTDVGGINPQMGTTRTNTPHMIEARMNHGMLSV